jgi:pimeloyl-ACP methyl ester carboxylesterase
MTKVTSKDGTKIAYDNVGKGQPIILVDGALCHRTFGPNIQLAPLLAQHFMVITYDRRGRGDSGDTQPHTVEKEIDDIEAIIKDLGDSVFIYGISSGGALALEAAKKLKSIKKLGIYEAPYIVDNSRQPLSDDYLPRLQKLITENHRGDAVKMFMRTVEVPSFILFLMQLMPVWSKLKAIAHTLPYDFSITIDNQKGEPFPSQKWNSVTIPAIVINGGKSPTWMQHSMRSLADVLRAEYKILEGQTHMIKAKILAPVLIKFFTA